jgi:hypothetical protein
VRPTETLAEQFAALEGKLAEVTADLNAARNYATDVLQVEIDEVTKERDAAWKSGWDAAKREDAGVFESYKSSAESAHRVSREALRLIRVAAQWLEPSAKLANLSDAASKEGTETDG